MKTAFSDEAWDDYLHWQTENADMLEKVNTLIEAIKRDPFKGIGKPEPLKGILKGWWSRRITDEHRLVYRVEGKSPDQTLTIIQARYHYNV
jgi:toxin YoeB